MQLDGIHKYLVIVDQAQQREAGGAGEDHREPGQGGHHQPSARGGCTYGHEFQSFLLGF